MSCQQHDETPFETSHPNSDSVLAVRLGRYLVPRRALVPSMLVNVVDTTSESLRAAKIIEDSLIFSFLRPYVQLPAHSNINPAVEVLRLDCGRVAAVVFDAASVGGDLHAFLKARKGHLGERRAVPLFRQIVQAVTHCHENGVVVRDLKLQKFGFVDQDRSVLKLMSLDDAVALENPNDDLINDKHCCPAYASPEIVHPSKESYSGRAADIWSLGVILYAMIVGKYPFYDTNPANMFNLIREGQLELPAHLSHMGKSLVSNMLRVDPKQRSSAKALLNHPWFYKQDSTGLMTVRGKAAVDQTVPENYADTPSMF
eukprot:m.3109 g.3109  ORF g.3109 m.3109 type:complete len:314 (+) comp9056_c0_seq2:224-1165(+)